jgi:hypothetical protein
MKEISRTEIDGGISIMIDVDGKKLDVRIALEQEDSRVIPATFDDDGNEIEPARIETYMRPTTREDIEAILQKTVAELQENLKKSELAKGLL